VNFYFTSTIGELITDYVNGKIPELGKRENIELRKSTII
jgi:3-isopropylmalate dehydrogenase